MTDKPAFPSVIEERNHDGGFKYFMTHEGMGERTLIAALALVGLCADPERNGSVEEYATAAVRHADALIAELAKEDP